MYVKGGNLNDLVIWYSVLQTHKEYTALLSYIVKLHPGVTLKEYQNTKPAHISQLPTAKTEE